MNQGILRDPCRTRQISSLPPALVIISDCLESEVDDTHRREVTRSRPVFQEAYRQSELRPIGGVAALTL